MVAPCRERTWCDLAAASSGAESRPGRLATVTEYAAMASGGAATSRSADADAVFVRLLLLLLLPLLPLLLMERLAIALVAVIAVDVLWYALRRRRMLLKASINDHYQWRGDRSGLEGVLRKPSPLLPTSVGASCPNAAQRISCTDIRAESGRSMAEAQAFSGGTYTTENNHDGIDPDPTRESLPGRELGLAETPVDGTRRS